MNRTAKIVVVALIVVAMVGTGWLGVVYLLLGHDSDDGSSDPAPTAVSTSPAEGSTEPPRPDLAPYYSQEIDWEACGDNQCGTLTVPIDYRQNTRLANLGEPALGA